MRPLATPDFLRFLSELGSRRASGVLVVERAGVETRVELKDGLATTVEGGGIAETLGRLLIEEGALGRASYAAVLAQITAAESRLERKRFGEAAIECGFLTEDQLDDALRAQLRLKLARAIELEKVRARFDDGSILEPGPRHSVALESAVIGALWRFDDARLAELMKPFRGRKLALTAPVDDVVAKMALWDDEQPVVRALGERRVEDLVSDASLDAAPLLAALFLCGFAVPEGDDDGKRAKVLRPHPTRRRWTHLPSARVSMKSFTEEEPPSRVRAEAILRRMSNERDERRGTFANAPRSLAEVRLLAEAAFQLGMGHLAANTLDRACVEFARASDLVPSAAEYVLYTRYADFAARQARATGFDAAQRAARVAALEVAVDGALAQMPHLAFGHYVRGHIAMLEGRDADAITSFRRAARLDFDLVDAERQVRLLELKRRRSAPSHADATPAPAPDGGTADAPPVVAPAETVALDDLLADEPEPVAPKPTEVIAPRSPEPPPALVATVPPAAVAPQATIDSDPAYALPTAPEAPAPKRTWLPWALAAIVILAVFAGGATLFFNHTPTKTDAKATVPSATSTSAPTIATTATTAVSSSLTPSASASASAIATVSASAAATTAVPSATATTAASSEPNAPNATEGTLTAPAAAAKGHRVIVDGRSVGDAPGPFTLKCGMHTIQIGSHGKEQKLKIPCGGSLTVDN